MLRRSLLLTVVLAGATAAPASALAIDVAAVLGKSLDDVARKATVPVLVPDLLDLDAEQRVHGTGSTTRNGYVFTFSTRKGCRASACSLATVGAERGGPFLYERRVKLRNGVTGRFKPITCGASCSPAAIQFRRAGVTYEISAAVPQNTTSGQLAALRKAADGALREGPR